MHEYVLEFFHLMVYIYIVYIEKICQAIFERKRVCTENGTVLNRRKDGFFTLSAIRKEWDFERPAVRLSFLSMKSGNQ